MVKRMMAVVAVTAMVSSAQAAFTEDFESGIHVVGQEPGAPWESLWENQYGNGNYIAGHIANGYGTNTSKVLDMVDSASWGSPITALDPANQFSMGFVQWDMATPNDDGSGARARAWFNTDGAVGGPSSGDWVVNLSFISDAGSNDIWERPPGSNYFNQTTPPNRADGVMQLNEWETYRVDFNFLDGVNGSWQLYRNDVQILSGALGTDGLASTKTLQAIGWADPTGDGFLIDNIIVDIPEPSAGLLLAGGLALLIRRRA